MVRQKTNTRLLAGALERLRSRAFHSRACGAEFGVEQYFLDKEPASSSNTVHGYIRCCDARLIHHRREAFSLETAPLSPARLSTNLTRPLPVQVGSRSPTARPLAGPDHPDGLRWLWDHWGTIETLRRVALAPDRDETAPEETIFRVSFWAADWTPWRALAIVQARFPALRFDAQPHYERA